ncbi:hypothetical protein [Nocardia sp. NPDC056100]|uniref:hypothetical protein n=1 Tax=Nocardia sp. NPDC056100 TaxID=3345712 RepID=UPI0035DDB15A
MPRTAKTFLCTAIALLAVGAAAGPASAARDSGATAFDEVSITGNSPLCFGRLEAEMMPAGYDPEGGVRARFDFWARVPFVPHCVVPATIYWQNLDTGGSGAIAHDIVPVDPFSGNTAHGVGGEYLYFPTGKGRIALRMSTNPGQVEITVR